MPRRPRSLTDLGFTCWSPTLLWLIGSLILIVTPSFALGQGLVDTISIQGDFPPEGNGTFALFNTPVLNDAGQVAFGATLINTANAPDDNYGIYRADATPGSLVKIQREFFGFGIGVQALDTIPAINSAGQVVTHQRALGLLGGDRDQYRISDGSSVTTIDLFGDAAPDGNGTFTDFLPPSPSFNNASQVAFRGTLIGTSGGSGDNLGIFRGSGGMVTQIAREGQGAPNANGTFNFFPTFTTLNDAGHVAFIVGLIGTLNDSGIFRGSGGPITRIVREGQSAPDANGTFSIFIGFALNDAGQAAFSAQLTGTSGGVTDNRGVFRGSGGTITQIARQNQNLPGIRFDSGGEPAINNAGQAAFQATQTGLLGGDQRSILRGSGGTLKVIVRETQAAPDANGSFDKFRNPALNNAGQAAFFADLTGTNGGATDDGGIFLGDGQEIITAAREGQPLAGSTIATILSFQGVSDPGGRSGLNEFRQVAYAATLDNGQEGIFLFTPKLHWRTAGSGNWDDCTNWTVGAGPPRDDRPQQLADRHRPWQRHHREVNYPRRWRRQRDAGVAGDRPTYGGRRRGDLGKRCAGRKRDNHRRCSKRRPDEPRHERWRDHDRWQLRSDRRPVDGTRQLGQLRYADHYRRSNTGRHARSIASGSLQSGGRRHV